MRMEDLEFCISASKKDPSIAKLYKNYPNYLTISEVGVAFL